MKIDAWYCAGWSRELAGSPLGRHLLGRRVVLFRDGNGTAHALGARCPHRGADLARGSVVDGYVQCPFHGWRFDGVGKCVRVPSQPEGTKVSSLARVPSFPLREREGVLWIWMGTGETSREPPEDPVPQGGRAARRLFFDAQLVEAPFVSVLENAFDRAHLPFIHEETFGPDQDPLVTRQRVLLESDGRGLRAEDDPSSPWQTAPRLPKGILGLLGRLLLGLREPIAQRMRFEVEGGQQICLEYPNGTADLFVTHLTPADEGHTWLFVESMRTRAPHAIGDWIQRRVIGRIFEEGRRETSLILHVDPHDPPDPVSVESDRVGLAARRLYESWARGSGAPARDHGLAVDV
jgi:phenylpropionate dioxygenase-like ring-hydroxylating dioxygenase large terminal subunit